MTNKAYQFFKQVKEKYGDQNFAILCFPCNQFGGQEPDPVEKIRQDIERKFDLPQCPEFQHTKKVCVNPENDNPADPIWNWLRNKSASKGTVKWNFMTSFVITKNGQCVTRANNSTWGHVENLIKAGIEGRHETEL